MTIKNVYISHWYCDHDGCENYCDTEMKSCIICNKDLCDHHVRTLELLLHISEYKYHPAPYCLILCDNCADKLNLRTFLSSLGDSLKEKIVDKNSKKEVKNE